MNEADVQGWLDDIENALRGIFTSSSDEDEAFDNATRSLDALRPFVLAQREALRKIADEPGPVVRWSQKVAASAAGGETE